MVDERPVAVIDLDGVVADVRHRLQHIEGAAKDWVAFFAGIPDDPVLPEGRAVVDRLATDHELIYLTGRPERTRSDTEAWLRQHRLPHGTLIMRRYAERGRTIAVVVDDDPQVCDAIEKRGWPVLRADWMTRPESLEQAQEDAGRT